MCSVLERSKTFPGPGQAREPSLHLFDQHVACPRPTKLKRITALIVGAISDGYISPPDSPEHSSPVSPFSPKKKRVQRSSSARSLRLGQGNTSCPYTSLDGFDPEVDLEDHYSNSNISASFPLEICDPEIIHVQSPRRGTPRGRRSLLGRQSDEHGPDDHTAVYVGGSKRRFVISAQVVAHQLFKELLESDFLTAEETGGNGSVVLKCEVDYFQRLLFMIDRDGHTNTEELV